MQVLADRLQAQRNPDATAERFTGYLYHGNLTQRARVDRKRQQDVNK